MATSGNSYEASVAYHKRKRREKECMETHDFSKWFSLLETLTFESLSIPMEKDHATAIVRLYHFRVNGSRCLTPKEKESLQSFKERIGETLKKAKENPKFSLFFKNEKKSDGYFIRLSSRSPKDATMFEPYLTKTKEKMLKNLDKLIKKEGRKMNRNTQIIAFFQACVDTMKVKTIDEMVDLLANSERVLTDLNTWIFGGDDSQKTEKKEEKEKGNFGISLILRRWQQIEIGTEYRGFIGRNGELNALCQYGTN